MTHTKFQKMFTMTAGMALALSLVACGGNSKAKDSTDADRTAVEDTKKQDTGSDPADAPAPEEETETKKIIDSKVQSTPIANGYETGKHEATIVVEDYGTIKLELDADSAPIAVSNFAELANQHFYDGLTFHRIMRNFMIQGGDPNGDGTGGSDTLIKGEFANNGVDNPLKHTRGAISMARSMDMDSASSQFFICDADDSFLDGDYAVFGYVTEGMDVVDAIAKAANPIDGNGTIPAAEQPVIKSIVVGDGSLG